MRVFISDHETMHKQFLLAALDQACLGRGSCAPNPCVGAIAVQNGKIIAQSWHRGAGTSHAEQLLLAQLPENLPKVTLYVTMEPCNHWGKTPPCVDAIIKYGIQQVVYAFNDPNPLVVANNTPEILRSQGIEVLYHPISEINAFYQSYSHWILTHKPWVTVKMAQSMDGKIAGSKGERVLLSNSLCAEFTHRQRLQSDVILTTAETINLDNPLLNVRLPTIEMAKPVAIIDPQGTLKQRANVFDSAKYCRIYYDERHKMVKKRRNCFYHPMPAEYGRLDLEAVIKHLGSLGYHDVWVEAGGRLFGALHRAGLVQRTYLYLVPTFLGQKATSIYPYAERLDQASQITWQKMGDNMIVSFDWQKETDEVTCLPA